MRDFLTVNPGDGRRLRDEDGRVIEATEKGIRVANSTYMRRRLKSGDAVLVIEDDTDTSNQQKEVDG
jgi:hypothetical protein